jgi:two-component system, cell cycle response regulator DivK
MPGEQVLIVDDHPVNLDLAKIVLELAGYEVQGATDAEEALTLLKTYMPCLILMDIQLPGMDGLALTRYLRSDATYADTIIIALTAYAMKGDAQKAAAAGCDGYITKPISTCDFAELIAAYLARGRTPPLAGEFQADGRGLGNVSAAAKERA